MDFSLNFSKSIIKRVFALFCVSLILAGTILAQTGVAYGADLGAPTSLTASAGDKKVTLKWVKVEGATSYKIYQGKGQGQYDGVTPITPAVTESTATSNGVTTTYVSADVTSLENGRTYFFKVAAVAGGVTSDLSNEAVTSLPIQGITFSSSSLAAQNTAAPVVTGYKASTNHGGTAVSGTDDQYIIFDVYYDRPIKIKDNNAQAVIDELNIVFSGTYLNPTSSVKVGDDGKSLHFELHFPFAGYAEDLAINSLNKSGKTLDSVTSADGTAVNFPIVYLVVPNGIQMTTDSQGAGSDSVQATVTKKVIAPNTTTRGMIHFLFLKNGVPVGATDAYGGNLTSHFHMYLTMTAADLTKNLATAFNSSAAAGKPFEGYTATAVDDKITITADNAAAGEVLDLLVIDYPRDRDTQTDKSALSTQITAAQNAKQEVYTQEAYATLKTELAKATAMKNSTVYLQSEVNAQGDKLKAAIANKFVTISTDALKAKIAEGERKVQGSYTEESFGVLRQALADAQNLLANSDNVTQSQIDGMVNTLATAISSLKVVETPTTPDVPGKDNNAQGSTNQPDQGSGTQSGQHGTLLPQTGNDTQYYTVLLAFAAVALGLILTFGTRKRDAVKEQH